MKIHVDTSSSGGKSLYLTDMNNSR
jgi:hypothetical protein